MWFFFFTLLRVRPLPLSLSLSLSLSRPYNPTFSSSFYRISVLFFSSFLSPPIFYLFCIYFYQHSTNQPTHTCLYCKNLVFILLLVYYLKRRPYPSLDSTNIYNSAILHSNLPVTIRLVSESWLSWRFSRSSSWKYYYWLSATYPYGLLRSATAALSRSHLTFDNNNTGSGYLTEPN